MKNKKSTTIIIGIVLAVVVLAILFFVNRSTGYAVVSSTCGDGICSAGEDCEWNGGLNRQMMCDGYGSILPLGATCSACKIYQAPGGTCVDSDGGIVRLIKGSVAGIAPDGHTYINWDTCTNAGTLLEYSCAGNLAVSKSIACNTENNAICSNGACIKLPSLSCYPDVFIEKKLLSNMVIVVGKTAPSSDTFAAVDVGSNLKSALSNTCTGVLPDQAIPTFTDEEATPPENYNLVIVGTEGYNTLIPKYKLSKSYTHGSIQLVQNKNNFALLVIGKTTAGTQHAAKALQSLKNLPSPGQVVCVNENSQIVAC